MPTFLAKPVQKWSWVGRAAGKGARKDLKRRIEDELHRFERFQLAEEEPRTAPAEAGPRRSLTKS